MVNRNALSLASLFLLVACLAGPALAAFTIEAIDPGRGTLSPGSKLDYKGGSEDDEIAVDLYLYNPDSKFSFLVQADVAPEPNSTFEGNFRIPNDTPPALNYVLAIFQDLAQPYLASSLPFQIAPLPSNPPPSPSTQPPTSTVYSTPPNHTPPHSNPLPRPSATPSDRPQPTSLPTTRSSSSPTTTTIAASSNLPSPNHSSAAPGTTYASDITNAPAPTSPGRPPLDASQDTEPVIGSAQVNISAIVGGTVGTVVAAGLVLWIFLCWRKYTRKSKGIPQPFPFLIVPPLRVLPSPAETSQQHSPISDHSTTCMSTIPDPYYDVRLRGPEKQAEILRQERQRIDTQLAKLEGSGYGFSSSRPGGKTFTSRTDFSSSSSASISSPSTSTAPTSTPSDLLEELNAMRQKVRQLEAERDANPPSFDDNPPQSLNLGGRLPPAHSASNPKAALRSNSHSLFSPPPEYDTTSPLHNSSHHSPASKTQCFCRDCG